MFKNTAIYFCNTTLLIYGLLRLITTAWQCRMCLCVRLTGHLPSTLNTARVSCMILQRNLKARLYVVSALRRRAAPAGFWGVLGSFAAFVAAQREPQKSTSSGARNLDGKWQEQEDKRRIQSKEIDNASYLDHQMSTESAFV